MVYEGLADIEAEMEALKKSRKKYIPKSKIKSSQDKQLAEVRARIEQIQKSLAETEERETEYKDTHRIEFFKPLPHQQQALNYAFDGKKTILVQGGNQIGKTVLGANFVGSNALGVQPWDGRDPIGKILWGNEPLKIRIICQDWEKHAKEVIIPELKHWLPAGTYRTEKNTQGVESKWIFPETRSTIELMTDMQECKLHEGWKGHIVWADEPPERDKYVANKRGLLRFNGIFLFTMTAVKASWVLDDIVRNTDPSFASITGVRMDQNPHLSKEAIQQFIATVNAHEYIARVEGGWLNLEGLILDKFNIDKHIVDDFPVDPTWPVVAMIDHHTQKPHALSFFAFDPHGNKFHIEDIWEPGGPEDVAAKIIRKKTNKEEPWRIERAFIDPLSKGDTENIRRLGVIVEDSFTRIQNALRPFGIILEVASKDKKSGIDNVNDWLEGPNKRPTLFFFRNVSQKIKDRVGKIIEGTVYEAQRWVYDEDGVPLKENDHFMENLYRLTLTGIKYTPPISFLEKPAGRAYDPLNYGL